MRKGWATIQAFTVIHTINTHAEIENISAVISID